MLEVKSSQNDDGTFDLEVTYKECGGPITHSDEFGMWCDKECRREEAMRIAPIMDEFIN